MRLSFRTRVPVRHNCVLWSTEMANAQLGGSFCTRVPVRPARMVFHPERIQPRTPELLWKIHEWAGKDCPVYSPLVFRGNITNMPDEVTGEVSVRLGEEPSGRPLEADLPRIWFEELDLPIFVGFPFVLYTWIRMDDVTTGRVSDGHYIESLWQSA